MLKSRLSWRLYGSYVALLCVACATAGVLVHRRLEQRLVDGLRQHVARAAEGARDDAAAWAEATDRAAADVELERAAAAWGVRLTLLDATGRAVLDSQLDAARLGDESRLPEVARALEAGRASVTRRSLVSDRDNAYEALRIEGASGEAVGVLRAAAPLGPALAPLEGLVWPFAAGAALAGVLGLFLARAVARRFARPVSELADVAEALRTGEYARRVAEPGEDELGQLGSSLNRLGEEMTARIATIGDDDARLRAMLAAMVEGVIAVDADDRIVFANHAACELLGLREDEAIGRPMWQLLRAADLVKLLEEAHAHGHAARGEVQLQRQGRDWVLEAHVTPFGRGPADGLVVVLHDISELRRLERVRRDFVANVSHELKTPLTSIKGYVETLLDGALHDEQNNVRFLEKIAAHVGRLAHLVTDLLSLARIESQQGALPREPVELGPLVQRALRRYDEIARAKDIALRFDGAGAPVVVLGDGEAVTQVVDNLLDNAIKYTQSGAIAVRVERAGPLGRISVSDSGIGIPAEDQERIFERFYRVDKARSREVGGTGLGLSIVKHLVQAMQGTVEVESRLGEGSRFTVGLPLVRPAGAPAAAMDAAPDAR